jgi:hypothetical protein
MKLEYKTKLGQQCRKKTSSSNSSAPGAKRDKYRNTAE